MAIQQPTSSDNLNSPDHAKLHRVLGIDTLASDESVVIDSAGNVGIGTTSPSSNKGSRRTLQLEDTTNDVEFRMIGSNNAEFTFDVLDGISQFSDRGGNEMRFLTMNGIQSGFIVESSGNMGVGDRINTISASAQLEVTASGGSDDLFMLSSTNDVHGNLVTVLNSGNVGIGTTTPDTKLHISGGETREALSADPVAPAANSHVIWQSNGVGSGDDGDIMMKITDSAGTTKTVTLVDYSVN